MKQYDFLLVGAGLFNSVFAYQAKRHGKRCLVIDKRAHLGGNIHCEKTEGIVVHKYGPHIFHTDNKEVWDFVNTLTPFNSFTLNIIAYYKGRVFNLPFNMNTFHQMWGVVTPEEAKKKLSEIRRGNEGTADVSVEQQALQLVGRDMYETLIKGYTEKQWGRPCEELPGTILKRLPVRFTYDNNYFTDRYQGIPQEGYDKLVERLLQGVECRTGCNYFGDKDYFDRLADKIVFSGAIDEFFNYEFGALEYRSLRFEEATLMTDNWQGNAVVNYTDREVPYTRIIEHKHFDAGNAEAMRMPVTIITKEYPLPVPLGERSKTELYYPVNDERNNKLYGKYRERAGQSPHVIFGGRLAEYRYMDMDDVIESSMKIFKQTKTDRI